MYIVTHLQLWAGFFRLHYSSLILILSHLSFQSPSLPLYNNSLSLSITHSIYLPCHSLSFSVSLTPPLSPPILCLSPPPPSLPLSLIPPLSLPISLPPSLSLLSNSLYLTNHLLLYHIQHI